MVCVTLLYNHVLYFAHKHPLKLPQNINGSTDADQSKEKQQKLRAIHTRLWFSRSIFLYSLSWLLPSVLFTLYSTVHIYVIECINFFQCHISKEDRSEPIHLNSMRFTNKIKFFHTIKLEFSYYFNRMMDFDISNVHVCKYIYFFRLSFNRNINYSRRCGMK